MVKQPVSPLAASTANRRDVPLSARPRRGWGVLLLLSAVLAVWVAVRIAVGLPSVPYNVRELFPSAYRTLRMGLFSVMVICLVVGPAWAGWILGRWERLGWVLLVPSCLVVCAVALVLARMAVTYESILDVVGSPVWPGRDLWEVTVRWCALASAGLLPWTSVAFLYGTSRTGGLGRLVRQGLPGLLVSMVAMVVAWQWVVVWNETDNIDELIVDGFSGPAFLSALGFLLALQAQAVQHLWSRRSLKSFLIGACLLAVGIGPGWLLFRSGLVRDLHKYELVYSGPQFLLGQDRRMLLSHEQLFFRWTILHTSVVLLAALAMRVAILTAGRKKVQRPASARVTADQNNVSRDSRGRQER